MKRTLSQLRPLLALLVIVAGVFFATQWLTDTARDIGQSADQPLDFVPAGYGVLPVSSRNPVTDPYISANFDADSDLEILLPLRYKAYIEASDWETKSEQKDFYKEANPKPLLFRLLDFDSASGRWTLQDELKLPEDCAYCYVSLDHHEIIDVNDNQIDEVVVSFFYDTEILLGASGEWQRVFTLTVADNSLVNLLPDKVEMKARGDDPYYSDAANSIYTSNYIWDWEAGEGRFDCHFWQIDQYTYSDAKKFELVNSAKTSKEYSMECDRCGCEEYSSIDYIINQSEPNLFK